jgi:hypothetical protein
MHRVLDPVYLDVIPRYPTITAITTAVISVAFA